MSTLSAPPKLKPSRRQSLVKQLDIDIAFVEEAFVEALGENLSTLPLSFDERKQSFCQLADVVEGFAANELWRAHPLASEMHEHAQRLQIECVDDQASTLDVEWLTHLRHLMPMVRRELAQQLVLDPGEAVVYLLGEFRGGDVESLREVLGASPRALRAWLDQGRTPRGLDPERLVLTAQVVADLSRALDRDSIIEWFLTPQDRLDGQTAAQVLDEVDAAPRPASTKLLELSASIAIFASL